MEADPPLPQHILSGRSVGRSVSRFRQQQPVLRGGLGGYAVGPEPWDAGWAGGCVVPWGCVVAGGEPVCSWAWNWASCSGLASVFSRLFSCSSWEFFSISSLICSLRTSTSSLTAYIKWLFTRSCKGERQRQKGLTYGFTVSLDTDLLKQDFAWLSRTMYVSIYVSSLWSAFNRL